MTLYSKYASQKQVKWALIPSFILGLISILTYMFVAGLVVRAAEGDPVCIEGGECFSTIQDAIDNADAGSVVLVAAGEYNQEKASIAIDKPITIKGANAGVAGNGERGEESVVYGNWLITNGSEDLQDITIDGFDIKNDGGTSYSTNAIRANTTATTKMTNVNVVNNRIVRDVRAGGNQYEAIKFNGEYHDVTISDNYFSKNDTDIAFIGDTITGLRQSGNLEVLDNVSLDSATFISLAFTDQTRIAGNTISDAAGRVFFIDGAVDGVDIEHNHIHNAFSVLSVNRANSGRSINKNIAINRNNLTNSNYGIYINSYAYGSAYEGVLDSRDNWWGTESGPLADDNPSGTGTLVSLHVAAEYQPWLCQPYGDGTRGSVDGSCDKLNLTKPAIEGFTQNSADRSVITIEKGGLVHDNGEDPNKTRIVWGVDGASDYGMSDLKALRFATRYPGDADDDWHQSGIYARAETPYETGTDISVDFFTIPVDALIGPHGQGEYDFKLQVQDNSDQWSDWSDPASLSYAVKKPASPQWVAGGEVPATVGYTNKQNGTIVWDPVTSGGAASYNYYQINADGSQHKLSGQPTALSEGEGVYRFCVKAVDENGNESDCSQVTVVYDKTDPTVMLNEDLVAATDNSLEIYGFVSDANLDHYYCVLKDQYGNQVDGAHCGASLVGGMGAAFGSGVVLLSSIPTSDRLGRIDTSGLADGNYNLYVVAIDLAGNRQESNGAGVAINRHLDAGKDSGPSLGFDVRQDRTEDAVDERDLEGTDSADTEQSTVDRGEEDASDNVGSRWLYAVPVVIIVGIVSWMVYSRVFGHKSS